MTVRISIRRYEGDQSQHMYRTGQLDEEPLPRRVEPVCSPWSYPILHLVDKVGHDDLPDLGGMVDGCPGCGVWARQNRHTVVVRGLVCG